MSTSEEPSGRFHIRTTTLGLLGAGIVLLAAALLVGVSDNLPGILLLYASALALVLAVTHRWKDPKKFGYLTLGSILGFFIFVIVHNFSEVGAGMISHLPVLAFALTAISVIAFILALFVCPWGCVVGVLGAIRGVDSQRRGKA